MGWSSSRIPTLNDPMRLTGQEIDHVCASHLDGRIPSLGRLHGLRVVRQGILYRHAAVAGAVVVVHPVTGDPRTDHRIHSVREHVALDLSLGPSLSGGHGASRFHPA